MGIFQSLLGAMGFQNPNDTQKEPLKKDEEKVSANLVTEKKYNVSNLICYAPKSNSEVKLLVDCLKKNEPCIINLAGLNEMDIKSVLDFLGGAVYALGGSISRLQGELYVMSPSGIKITSA